MVPNRQRYADWKDIQGFGLVGDTSFFPHMDDTWKPLVCKKLSELSVEETVFCLRDDEVCCVEGQRKKWKVLSMSVELAR